MASMITRRVFLGLAVAALFVPTTFADEAADALKALQGTWATENDESKWTFDKDTVKTSIGGNDYVSKAIIVNAKSTPKQIDFEVKEGDAAGGTALGIYKLEGEELTICIAIPGVNARPTQFEAKEGELYVFKLKKKKS